MVVKKDGTPRAVRAAEADRRAAEGVREAAGQRRRRSKAIADRVEATLQERPEKEIATAEIGAFVMEELKQLDKVAYVRFASVYRHFRDIGEFMNELKDLLNAEGMMLGARCSPRACCVAARRCRWRDRADDGARHAARARRPGPTCRSRSTDGAHAPTCARRSERACRRPSSTTSSCGAASRIWFDRTLATATVTATRPVRQPDAPLPAVAQRRRPRRGRARSPRTRTRSCGWLTTLRPAAALQHDATSSRTPSTTCACGPTRGRAAPGPSGRGTATWPGARHVHVHARDRSAHRPPARSPASLAPPAPRPRGAPPPGAGRSATTRALILAGIVAARRGARRPARAGQPLDRASRPTS